MIKSVNTKSMIIGNILQKKKTKKNKNDNR